MSAGFHRTGLMDIDMSCDSAKHTLVFAKCCIDHCDIGLCPTYQMCIRDSSTTTFLTNLSSFTSHTRGIMISGSTFQSGCAFLTDVYKRQQEQCIIRRGIVHEFTDPVEDFALIGCRITLLRKIEAEHPDRRAFHLDVYKRQQHGECDLEELMDTASSIHGGCLI